MSQNEHPANDFKFNPLREGGAANGLVGSPTDYSSNESGDKRPRAERWN